MLGAIALLALGAAIVFALLWFSSTADRDDALAERESAVAEAAAASDAAVVAEDELVRAQIENETAASEIARLEAELEAATSLTEDVDAAAADAAAEAEARAAELAAELERTSAAEDELEARIEELEAELETVAGDTIDGPAPQFDPSTVPEFTRYIGETLSSRTGSSRLAQAQSECFGAAIIDAIGLDALGNGLNLEASNADRGVVITAMEDAAAFCRIDPALVFG